MTGGGQHLSVRVAVRVRPLNVSELDTRSRVVVEHSSPTMITLGTHSFTYDDVFPSTVSQHEMYVRSTPIGLSLPSLHQRARAQPYCDQRPHICVRAQDTHTHTHTPICLEPTSIHICSPTHPHTHAGTKPLRRRCWTPFWPGTTSQYWRMVKPHSYAIVAHGLPGLCHLRCSFAGFLHDLQI